MLQEAQPFEECPVVRGQLGRIHHQLRKSQLRLHHHKQKCECAALRVEEKRPVDKGLVRQRRPTLEFGRRLDRDARLRTRLKTAAENRARRRLFEFL